MKRLHIVGRKNQGKTGLVVDLVEEFKRRGFVVGTVKHTHHQHELDSPGKDSHRHRCSGSDVVGILSRSMCAVFLPMDRDSSNDPYEAIQPVFDRCDLVLVEGDTKTSAAKIEVWRAALNQPPMSKSDSSILAIVTDDSIKTTTPVFARNNIRRLADWVVEQVAADES